MSELRAAVRSLARMMLLILLAAGAIGALVYMNQVRAPKLYESTSRYFVSPVTEIHGGEVRDLVDALNTLDREVMTVSVAEVIGSDVMLGRAAEVVGIADTSQYTVSANRVPSSLAVEVYVQGPSPEGTRLISEGIGTEANPLLRSLIGAFEIQPLDVPSTPTSPISPRPLRSAVFAGGLVVIALSMIRLVTSPADETGLRRSMWGRLLSAAQRGRSYGKPPAVSRLELRPEERNRRLQQTGQDRNPRIERPEIDKANHSGTAGNGLASQVEPLDEPEASYLDSIDPLTAIDLGSGPPGRSS